MSLIIHRQDDGKALLVGSLSTVQIFQKRLSSSHIRENAKTLQASHFTVSPAGDSSSVRFFTPPLEFKLGKNERLYSVADLFAKFLAINQPDVAAGALICDVPQSNSKLLVIVERGVVTVDHQLDNFNAAINELTTTFEHGGITTFTTSKKTAEDVVDIAKVDLTKLLNFANPADVLKQVPRNPLRLLIPVIALVLASGAYGYYELVYKPEVERAASEAKAKKDKTQAYLNQLGQAMMRSGWKRSDMLQSIRALENEPIFISGWINKLIACNFDQGCSSTWDRKKGEIPTLTSIANSGWVYDVSSSNLDSSVFLRKKTFEADSMHVDQLPTKQNAKMEMYDIFTKLSNADIRSNSAQPKNFPLSFGDFSGVRNKNLIVQREEFSVAMPLHRASEVIEMMPQYVTFAGYTLHINPASKTDIFIFNLKGYIYAR